MPRHVGLCAGAAALCALLAAAAGVARAGFGEDGESARAREAVLSRLGLAPKVTAPGNATDSDSLRAFAPFLTDQDFETVLREFVQQRQQGRCPSARWWGGGQDSLAPRKAYRATAAPHCAFSGHVLNVGLFKTGTKSTTRALQLLGYPCSTGSSQELQAQVRNRTALQNLTASQVHAADFRALETWAAAGGPVPRSCGFWIGRGNPEPMKQLRVHHDFWDLRALPYKIEQAGLAPLVKLAVSHSRNLGDAPWLALYREVDQLLGPGRLRLLLTVRASPTAAARSNLAMVRRGYLPALLQVGDGDGDAAANTAGKDTREAEGSLHVAAFYRRDRSRYIAHILDVLAYIRDDPCRLQILCYECTSGQEAWEQLAAFLDCDAVPSMPFPVQNTKAQRENTKAQRERRQQTGNSNL